MRTSIIAACLAALHVRAAGFAVQTPLKNPRPLLTPLLAPHLTSSPTVVMKSRPSKAAFKRKNEKSYVESGQRQGRGSRSREAPSEQLSVESAFAAKVFGTLGVQIGATAAAATAIVNTPVLRAVASSNHPMVLPAGVIGLALALFCRTANDDLPLAGKVGYLSAFTLVESWLIGVICTSYVDAGLGNLLLQAAGITTFDVAVLTSYALTSKGDFSYLGGALYGALLALIGGGLVKLCCMAVPSLAPLVPMQDLALSVTGALVFCVYIVYDVAMLKKDYLEQEDYIGATMNLYLDVLNLFLDILRILARSSGDSDD